MRNLLCADGTVAIVAAIAGYLVRFGPHLGGYRAPYVAISAALPAVWVALLGLSRAYEARLLFVGVDEFQRVVRAGVGLTAGVALFSYALEARLSRGYLLTVLVLVTALTVVTRFAGRKRLHRARRRGAYMRRVVVLGPLTAVAELTRQLHREYYHGLMVVGACVPAHQVPESGPPGTPTLGTPTLGTPMARTPVLGPFDQAAAAVRTARADTVLALACQELDGAALRRLAWSLEPGDVDLIVASSLLDVAGYRVTVRPVDGLPMLHVEHPKLTGARRVIKDLFDVSVAAVLLVLLAPVFALVAALIRAGSPGPVLFHQVRIGKNGRPFHILKFRTMWVGAEDQLAELRARTEIDGVLFKLRDDPRISRVGRLLRRYSVDELPQLINVVRGQMSLVGPRPPLPYEVDAYPEDMRRRLAVKPGLTGLWQVSGRADLPWEESIRLDLRYVENWSLSLDLAILLRTLSAVVRGGGAY